MRFSLRPAEWVLAGYFLYVAILSPSLPTIAIALLVPLIAFLGEIPRDWIPLGLTLVAYREMDRFSTLAKDHHLEFRWLEWDRWALHGLGIQRAIETLGAVLPSYFELCYLLVYAVGPFAVAVVYFERRIDLAQRVLFPYLLGTLAAYAMFPYFPSDPPRVLFGGTDLPNVTTALRRFNLWIVGGYGIHSSVFPSAHVSSAFSAAWAFFVYVPDKKRYGWGMLIYAMSVAIATVYGRYHYAADAVAGLAVSLAALMILLALRRLPLRGLA